MEDYKVVKILIFHGGRDVQMYPNHVVVIMAVERMRKKKNVHHRRLRSVLYGKILKETVLRRSHCYELMLKERYYECFLPTIRRRSMTVMWRRPICRLRGLMRGRQQQDAA